MAPDEDNLNEFDSLLGRPRPRWLCWVDAALLVKFLLTLLLVWVTLGASGCVPSLFHVALNSVGTPDGPVYGFRVFVVSPWLWLIVPLGFVVVRSLWKRPPRRTGLHALGVAMFRAGVLLTMLAVSLLAMIGTGTSSELGYYLAIAVLGLMFIFQMVVVVRNIFPMMAFLQYRRSLKRRNWWLVPGVVLNLLVTIAIWCLACYYSFELCQHGEYPLIIWPIFWTILLLLSALGMRHNETWGCWTHLIQGVFPVLCYSYLVLSKSGENIGWLWALLGLLIAWWLYPFFAGYRFSAHWLQRRRCGGCGKKRWLRAGRCGNCGERYWIPKDSRMPPVCLACMAEQSAPRPVCKACARRSSTPPVPIPEAAKGNAASLSEAADGSTLTRPSADLSLEGRGERTRADLSLEGRG